MVAARVQGLYQHGERKMMVVCGQFTHLAEKAVPEFGPIPEARRFRSRYAPGPSGQRFCLLGLLPGSSVIFATCHSMA